MVGKNKKGAKDSMMSEENSSCTCTGAVFISGKVVPVTGIYDFTSHFDGGPCFITHTENRLVFAKGNTFPRHGTCYKKVYWRLHKTIEEEEANGHSQAKMD